MSDSELQSDDQIQLFADNNGIAVIGGALAIARFFKAEGIFELAQKLPLSDIKNLASNSANAIYTAAKISEQSGMYLKLTKESAALVEKYGLMASKTPGVRHAMIGSPGEIQKWLTVDTSLGSLFSNPAVLSGLAGVMARQAMKNEFKQITEMLIKIDGKLDDVRRSQRDEVLARLERVSLAIDDAEIKRRHQDGLVSGVTWSQIQTEAAVIGEVTSSAIRNLEALAEKAETSTNIGSLAKNTAELTQEVNLWLATLAKCMQLQDQMSSLEIAAVETESPEQVDKHRLAVIEVLDTRRQKILSKTTEILNRLESAADAGRNQAVLHFLASPRVISSLNEAGDEIVHFQQALGSEQGRLALTQVRWRDAVRDRAQLATALREAGVAAAKTGLAVGAVAAAIGIGAAVGGKKDD